MPSRMPSASSNERRPSPTGRTSLKPVSRTSWAPAGQVALRAVAEPAAARLDVHRLGEAELRLRGLDEAPVGLAVDRGLDCVGQAPAVLGEYFRRGLPGDREQMRSLVRSGSSIRRRSSSPLPLPMPGKLSVVQLRIVVKGASRGPGVTGQKSSSTGWIVGQVKRRLGQRAVRPDAEREGKERVVRREEVAVPASPASAIACWVKPGRR